MSSITLTLTGQTSSLNAYFHPEIELDERFNYSCSLLGFYTYNSIANVYEKNNRFYYSQDGGKTFSFVYVPVGTYEISQIIEILTNELKHVKVDVRISTDRHTMRCTIISNCIIDFSRDDSIGAILGFKNKRKIGLGSFVSDHIVDILHVKTLRISCDLISGSFHNGKETHIIYEFDPLVDPGYKISETTFNLFTRCQASDKHH